MNIASDWGSFFSQMDLLLSSGCNSDWPPRRKLASPWRGALATLDLNWAVASEDKAQEKQIGKTWFFQGLRTLWIQPGQVTSAISPSQSWRKPWAWGHGRELFDPVHGAGWHSTFTGDLVSDTLTSEMTCFSCSSSWLETCGVLSTELPLGLWAPRYRAWKAALLQERKINIHIL